MMDNSMENIAVVLSRLSIRILQRFGEVNRDILDVKHCYEDNCVRLEGSADLSSKLFTQIKIYILRTDTEVENGLGETPRPRTFGLESRASLFADKTLVCILKIVSPVETSPDYIRPGRWINYIKKLGRFDNELTDIARKLNRTAIDDSDLFPELPDFDID